jgi:hypothetical protein
MKLYEVRTTEYNGEQEYSNSHLLAAKNIGHAKKLAREFFEKWYEDDTDSHADPDNPDKFEFMGGSIILKIKSIAETTLDDWKDSQVQLCSIGKLPKAKTSQKEYRMPIPLGVKEQCPDYSSIEIKVNILSKGGQIWIQPQGYGEKCAMDGQGWPIGIEVWQAKLRLIVFDDINSEDPQVIDLEKAKESCLLEDGKGCNCQTNNANYCRAAEYLAEQGRKIFTGRMDGGLWNARCLDACLLSKQQDDKAAYEFLLKFGDQLSRSLSESQKKQWQEIKDSAEAILGPVTSPGTINKNAQ